MCLRRLVLGAALSAAVAAAAVGESSAPTDIAADEQLLQQARLGTDGPSLLAYFRQRTVGDADRKRIEGLIRKLGDPAFAVRESALTELVGCGLSAVGPLRQAQRDPDVEIARRAERCLERIEKVPSTALSAAAARLVAVRKPEGSVGVLLGYLPLADDESVADEIRDALAAVALTGGRPDPLLEPALEDPLPIKRGAAAEALIRTGQPAALEASRKTLADGNLDVRLRTALGLVTHAKDRQAVPALIALLGELPQGGGWRIEEVLIRLAGDQAPQVSLGNDVAGRLRCRDAWQGWWQEHSAKADLAKLDGTPATLGYTLVVLRDARIATGQVVEMNANKEVLWKISGLQYPSDALVIGKDRVLIAEQNNHTVSERDFAGRTIWSTQVIQPSGLQRLPNGNIFVTSRGQLSELDTQHKEVSAYRRPQQDIMAAYRLRNGETVFLTNSGACIRLDAQRKETLAFTRPTYTYGDLEAFASGRVLMTDRNGVAEIEATGKQVWSAAISRPTSVQRLANGNTLVVGIPAAGGNNAMQVAELDRNGQPVWSFQPTDSSQPWRARRR